MYRHIKRKHHPRQFAHPLYSSKDVDKQESYTQIRRKYTNSPEGGYTVWSPDNFIKFMDEVIRNA